MLVGIIIPIPDQFCSIRSGWESMCRPPKLSLTYGSPNILSYVHYYQALIGLSIALRIIEEFFEATHKFPEGQKMK